MRCCLNPVQIVSKWSWDNFVNEKVKHAALKYLVEENCQKDRTKHIIFKELKMSDYLYENKNRYLSQIIFSVRSQTLNIKEWKPWNYHDNLCVKCQIYAETMDHFVVCSSYGNKTEQNWKDIFDNNYERQIEIGIIVKKRFLERQDILDTIEAGQTSNPAPILQLL